MQKNHLNVLQNGAVTLIFVNTW